MGINVGENPHRGCPSAKPTQKCWARQNPPFPESQASPAVPREEFLGNISGILSGLLRRLKEGKKTGDYLNSKSVALTAEREPGNADYFILSEETWKGRFIPRHWEVKSFIFRAHPTPNSRCKPRQPFLQTPSLESSSQPPPELPWGERWIALPKAVFLGIWEQIPGARDLHNVKIRILSNASALKPEKI